jgi:hypothetical protein
MGSARERLSSVELPSFEMLSESSDPDITPTRWDIDARALDRALASSPAPEEVELDDILEVAPAKPEPPPPIHARTLPLPPATSSFTLPPPPPLPGFPAISALALPPPNRGTLTSIDLILEEDPPEALYASTSYAPVTVEEPSPWLAESTFVLAPSARSRGRKAGVAWAIGLGLLAGIVIVGVALRSTGGADVTRLPAPVIATIPPPSPEVATGGAGLASSSSLSSAPTFDVTSLPRAPVGTVSLAAAASSHRLIVDGVVAPSGSAVVKCGKHMVRVGSKGRRQIVDVACGRDTVVTQ